MISVPTRDPTLRKLIGQLHAPTQVLAHIRMVFSASIGILILNVGTGLITARLLGPEGRGELAAIAMWPALAAGLLTLGLPRAITYHAARERGDASCLLLVGLSMSFCTGLVAAALGALFIPFWLREYPARTVEFAQWLMLGTPAVTLMLSINGALQARSEFTAYNRNLYLPPLLALVALAGLGFFGGLTPFTAALAMIGSSLPILIMNLIRVARSCRSGCSDPLRSLQRLLSYGMRIYGSDVIGRLLLQIDRVILVALLSPAAVGLYVVANSLARLARMLPNAIVTVLFPEASRKATDEAVVLLARASWVSTAISCIVALGLMVVAPTLLVWLYGEAFAPAIGPLRILLVDAVLVGFGWILVQAFMSSGRPGVVTITNLLGLLVSLACMLLLVPVLGITGAAIALLISTSVRLIFVLSCFPLMLNIRISSLLPQRVGLERSLGTDVP